MTPTPDITPVPTEHGQITATVRCTECGYRVRMTADTIADLAAFLGARFVEHNAAHHPDAAIDRKAS